MASPFSFGFTCLLDQLEFVSIGKNKTEEERDWTLDLPGETIHDSHMVSGSIGGLLNGNLQFFCGGASWLGDFQTFTLISTCTVLKQGNAQILKCQTKLFRHQSRFEKMALGMQEECLKAVSIQPAS